MNNLLDEKYNDLLELKPVDPFFEKKYLQKMNGIIELISICESAYIKELLIKEIKINCNSNFPVWLELLLLKVYILKNPKDKEMYELGISEYWRHLAEKDITVIEKALSPEI